VTESEYIEEIIACIDVAVDESFLSDTRADQLKKQILDDYEIVQKMREWKIMLEKLGGEISFTQYEILQALKEILKEMSHD